MYGSDHHYLPDDVARRARQRARQARKSLSAFIADILAVRVRGRVAEDLIDLFTRHGDSSSRGPISEEIDPVDEVPPRHEHLHTAHQQVRRPAPRSAPPRTGIGLLSSVVKASSISEPATPTGRPRIWPGWSASVAPSHRFRRRRCCRDLRRHPGTARARGRPIGANDLLTPPRARRRPDARHAEPGRVPQDPPGFARRPGEESDDQADPSPRSGRMASQIFGSETSHR